MSQALKESVDVKQALEGMFWAASGVHRTVDRDIDNSMSLESAQTAGAEFRFLHFFAGRVGFEKAAIAQTEQLSKPLRFDDAEWLFSSAKRDPFHAPCSTAVAQPTPGTERGPVLVPAGAVRDLFAVGTVTFGPAVKGVPVTNI